MTNASHRSARVEARLSPEALATIKRAAQLQGRSVSEFVAAAARDAAQRAIEADQVIRLSEADQERLADLLLNPAKLTSGLRRVYDTHRNQGAKTG